MKARVQRHQAWIYLTAAVVGLTIGAIAPDVRAPARTAVWPALAMLLYTTFIQVELARLREAARDRRFLTAVLLGNFVAMPVVVWSLLPLAGDDLALRVGVLLVLLVPCTDWFLTFTHLAGGDTRRAIVVTPVNLVMQAALLPVYLWIFVGHRMTGLATGGRLLTAFVLLIAVPLVAAWLTRRRLERLGHRAQRLTSLLHALPVPLLALVVLLVATAEVGVAGEALTVLPRLVVIYGAYLVAAALIGLGIAKALELTAPATTTVVFSLGTRNSFVVLPIALALPAGLEIAVVAVIVQSLVELFGMIAYLRIVPRLARTGSSAPRGRSGYESP